MHHFRVPTSESLTGDWINMTNNKHSISKTPVWKKLKEHAEYMKKPENHLKYLIQDKKRLDEFSLKSIDFFYDFSRQRVDRKAMDLLFELANTAHVHEKYEAMVAGAKVNVTENRAALHTAARNFNEKPVCVDGINIMPEINQIRNSIKDFSCRVHKGEITGSTKNPLSIWL